LKTYIFATEKATAERRVCDNGDAELTARLEHTDVLLFDIEAEWRVLHLVGGNRMDSMSTAEIILRDFRDADVFYIPFPGKQCSSQGNIAKRKNTLRVRPSRQQYAVV
jgi:hypothetical protein